MTAWPADLERDQHDSAVSDWLAMLEREQRRNGHQEPKVPHDWLIRGSDLLRQPDPGRHSGSSKT